MGRLAGVRHCAHETRAKLFFAGHSTSIGETVTRLCLTVLHRTQRIVDALIGAANCTVVGLRTA